MQTTYFQLLTKVFADYRIKNIKETTDHEFSGSLYRGNIMVATFKGDVYGASGDYSFVSNDELQLFINQVFPHASGCLTGFNEHDKVLAYLVTLAQTIELIKTIKNKIKSGKIILINRGIQLSSFGFIKLFNYQENNVEDATDMDALIDSTIAKYPEFEVLNRDIFKF